MLRSINRTLAFFSKWLAEVVRQPWLMVSLVIGPFLILLAFGEGVRVGIPEPRTLIVAPQSGANQGKLQPVPDEMNKYLNVVGETANLDDARRQLVDGKVDLVVVLPPDVAQSVRQGQHAPIRILTNDIDPVRKSYTHTFIEQQVASLNALTVQKAIAAAQASSQNGHQTIAQARQVVASMQSAQGNVQQSQQLSANLRAVLAPLLGAGAVAAGQGASAVIPGLGQTTPSGAQPSVQRIQSDLGQIDARLAAGQAPSSDDLSRIDADLGAADQALSEAQAIPPDVLASPFQLDLQDVAPFVPTYIGYYAPAVLALLIQHLAITLGALSMARIRLLGLMELMRASPVRPTEAVIGNYLSYGTLCVVAGGLLAALVVFVLGVPVYGSWLMLIGILLLLVMASLGIGFVISMISSSEQQAAQIAMLVLIASVFFSGFVVALDTLAWPFRSLAYLLPATYAIRSLQNVMLRGVLRNPTDPIVLGAVSAALFLVTISLFRREYRPR